MKKIYRITLAAILLATGIQSWAGNNGVGTFSIKTPNFVRPLVERWITEYSKVAPDVHFLLANGSVKPSEADINLVLDSNQGSTNKENPVVYFGQYAILPVTASTSDAARILTKKKLNESKLKKLFFIVDEFDDSEEKDKINQQVVIYSGSGSQSIAQAYASYFGLNSTSFKGKRISGDDAFLNTAINRDPQGVTFNALSNIFDLQSRKLKNGLTILPLDVKKSEAGIFASTANIDNVITTLEQDKIEGIPVERLGFRYSGKSEAVNQFLNWILTVGTGYNHQYGILSLDNKILTAQLNK